MHINPSFVVVNAADFSRYLRTGLCVMQHGRRIKRRRKMLTGGTAPPRRWCALRLNSPLVKQLISSARFCGQIVFRPLFQWRLDRKPPITICGGAATRGCRLWTALPYWNEASPSFALVRLVDLKIESYSRRLHRILSLWLKPVIRRDIPTWDTYSLSSGRRIKRTSIWNKRC